MRVLVTGGAGFIGSNVVARFLAAGHEIVVLDDLSSGYRKNLLPFSQIDLVEGDVRDERAVERATRGVEVVVHLAASVGNQRSIDNPVRDSEVNVLGTLRLLEAARRTGARKIVFSSSAGIFGELKTLPIREDHPAEPDTPYGAGKLAAEKHCLAYAKLYPGFEAICLRYFNVYGINQRYDAYGNVIPIFVHRVLRNEALTIYGDGEQTRDFVNVSDVSRANLQAALAQGVSGAFNIASGTRITVNALVESLRKASGRAIEVQHVPRRKGDVLHSLADISCARAAFGYNPSAGLDEGIVEYFRWAEQDLAAGTV
jgi:UDP-glucose 4-epimerase